MKRAACAALLLGAAPAFAAGGHHAVDDAAVVASGSCEAESWVSGARGGERLLHVGAQCGVGPFEVGIAAEPVRGGGANFTGYQAQLKWAAAMTEALALGLSATPFWQTHERPRHQGTTVSALASWNAAPGWMLHANAGRDLLRGRSGENRNGIGVEWTPANTTLHLERSLQQRTHFLRAGARWPLGDYTLDASYAQRLSGPVPSAWTLAVNRAFK